MSDQLVAPQSILEPKEKVIPRFKLLKEFFKYGYDFKYNDVNNQLEFKSKLDTEYKELKDFDLNTIWRNLQLNNIPIKKQELIQWLYSDDTAIFNPFKSYFSLLPKYNSDEPDYINELASTITVNEKDTALWRDWFKRWLVAVVACAVDDKVTNQTALIFVGGQGIGKTTWLEKLRPPRLIKYYHGGAINPNNKDTIIQLAECLFINMDELENLNRNDIGNLKEIITKSSVRIRRPYAMTSENMPRRASFMGSVNNIDFLNDPTGSRRFLVFETLNINFKHTIDIDRVYAQAYSLYKSMEFKYWFDGSDINMINSRNEQYKVISGENEVLYNYFQVCERSEKADLELTTLQVIDLINKDNSKYRLSPKSIGMALKACKFDRKKKNGLWYWQLKRRITE